MGRPRRRRLQLSGATTRHGQPVTDNTKQETQALGSRDAPELQLERNKVAGRSDRPGTKGIHEEDGNAAPGSVPQSSHPGAAAVSAATTTHTPPRRRSKRATTPHETAALGSPGERLRSLRLRPRVDAEAARVGGSKTRGGEATRRPRSRPRPTRSIS
jgi:hypothetical protein